MSKIPQGNYGKSRPEIRRGMNLSDVEAWLRDRLVRHGRRSKVMIDRPPTQGAQDYAVRARLWTAINVYAIIVKPFSNHMGYMGCVVTSRAPRPGEDHTRGSDLADGDLGDETLGRILADIVHYEALDVAPRLAEVPVGEGEGEFLPGRPVRLAPRTGPPIPTGDIELVEPWPKTVKITTAGKEVGTCDRCGNPTSLGHLGGFRCGDCLASS